MNQTEANLNIGRERLIKVYQYLEALHQHRNPVKRQIHEQQWVLWLRDLPEYSTITKSDLLFNNGVETDETIMADDFIIKVGRPKLTPVPEPPESIIGWLEPGWDNPESEVKIKATIGWTENEETILENFESDPERIEALKDWHNRRNEWAEGERPARAAMGIFERFYNLYGWIQKESERIEIMLGDGILNWRRGDGSINHPILLTRLQLEFNPSIPEFIITEADSETQLYSALFRSMTDVDGELVARFHEELGHGMYHPLGKTGTSEFLKRFVNQLSPRGEYSEYDHPEIDNYEPMIVRSPVIFVRDRSLGFGVAIEAVLEDLKERPDLPKHLLNIVGIETPMDEGEYEPAPEDTWSEPEDILLGKPANPEQITIARNIEKHHGVLVQGPPGTGKTHSIANLIGHFLSQGKSVLVTSHTTKALRVLRDQVVDELRPLCVSVLDSDSFSRQQLEASIEGIVNRLNTSNPTALNIMADRLLTERKVLITKLRTARQKLVEARSEEYRELVIAGESYSPAEAARKVAREYGVNDWIPKPVTPGVPLPLSENELVELYHTNVSLTAREEEELGHPMPDPSDLISPGDFTRLLNEITLVASQNLNYRSDLWGDPKPESIHTPNLIETVASQMVIAVSYISEQEPWKLAVLMAGFKGGLYREHWDSLLKIVADTLDFSVTCKESFIRFQPVITEYIPLVRQLATVTQIIEHLTKRTKLNGVQKLTHPSWAKFIENSKVKGKPPETLEHFTALANLIKLKIFRQEMVERWDLQLASQGAPSAAALGTEPETAAIQFCKIITNCLDWRQKTWSPLERSLVDVGFQWESFLEESPPNINPYGEMLRLKEAVTGPLQTILTSRANYLHYHEFKKQLEQMENLLLRLGNDCSEVVLHLKRAIQTNNSEAYQKAFQQLLVLDSKRVTLERRNLLLKRLEEHAPGWAKKIRLRNGIHASDNVPGDAGAAWLWRQINDELDLRGQVSLVELQQKIESLSSDLRTITSRLIEAKAWAAQLERVKIHERQSLVGYLDLMKKIGSGKGKRAPRLRVEARLKMAQCRTAVPVWIMPLSRVAENFNPKETRFDVVIVDEASQSDVMGLIALYLGQKVVIVGDHEQVSPLAIGQKIEIVEHMIAEHLQGIPNNLLYDGQMSVYDLARTSFGGTICLLEHFRCVPEIIEFSNQLSYRGRIKALRDTSQVRLKPAIIPYRVSNGLSDEKVNREEAKTIASLILALVEQPEYRNKTIGVISLLGDDQALEIDKILRRHLSEDEYANRKIVCGNAAQFQGDERDVMFLSIVHGPMDSRPLKMLDSGYQSMFQKRFNVAASRAKDQMWVVYSLDPKVNLKPGDLRRRLIEHAENLECLVDHTNNTDMLAQSLLEKEVLLQLRQAGYQVIPQWKVGYYSIDLVVEGDGKRLAIECDGDRVLPVEKMAEDMARQALLERLGWTFIRIRASQFFRNPERSIKPILDRLAELKIDPKKENHELVINDCGFELKERIICQAGQIYNQLIGSKISAESKIIKTDANDPIEVIQPVKQDNVIMFGKNNIQPSQETKGIHGCSNEKEKFSRIIKKSRAEQSASIESIVEEAPVSHLKTFAMKLAKKFPEARFDLLDFLSDHGLEIIDLRSQGGTIWIVGGEDLISIIDLLEPHGFQFKFLESGVDSTDNRPAWFLIS